MQNPDPRSIDLRTWPLQPQRWPFVLSVILAQHNWRHATKDKGVSYATMEARAQYLYAVFELLRTNEEKCFKLDPRSFSGRHLEFLYRIYERRAMAGELGPSSLQKYHSFLCTFCSWIGKPKLVKPIGAYIRDPALYRRSYVAVKSKTWRAQGVDVASKVEEIAQHDERAAVAVALMVAFGLRFKEAVMFRPHVDCVSKEQAGKPDSAVAFHPALKRGTKGGRLRYVPVDTPERMQAIERARRVALRDDESISDPRYTLEQAVRHLRYVMEQCGVTKRGLGVVPHGLRHQFAADWHQQLAGTLPVVEGGLALPAEQRIQVRQEISEQLGHARVQIASAYLGKR